MKKRELTIIIIFVILSVGLFVIPYTGLINNNAMRYMVQIFLYISLGEVWNLLSGYAGMTSLGQQAYIGLAGYSVAMATTVYKLHFTVGILIGILVSTVVSLILAFLLLRMRGMYFSITTWVVAEALGTFFLSWKYVGQGAGMTVSIVPYPRVDALYIMSLILVLVTLVIVYLLLRSKIGLGLTAMRDNISAAVSLGVDIGRIRLLVYIISAVITGIAGSIFFINKGTIYPDSGFSISWTISMVFICIIGGTGTIEGPVVGAVIYVLLQEFLAHYPGWSNIILGIIAILIIIYMPKGIVGTIKEKYEKAIYNRETVGSQTVR